MEKNTELLNTQMSVEETDKQNSGEQLIERIAIKDTPFIAIKTIDNGWFLSMGKYRISDEFEKYDDLLIWTNDLTDGMNWELMTRVIGVIVETTINNK